MQIAIAVENALAYRKLTESHVHLNEEKEYLEHEIQLRNDFGEIVGTSGALRRVLAAVKTVAPTDSTVLLLGETGTGKELIARAIHNLSGRHLRTFVRLSAALPTEAARKRAVGYEKGAFTGATSSRIGRLELAHRVLFLDEVGDIPASCSRSFCVLSKTRVRATQGAHPSHRCSVIMPFNRDLDVMVEDGSFRTIFTTPQCLPSDPAASREAGNIPRSRGISRRNLRANAALCFNHSTARDGRSASGNGPATSANRERHRTGSHFVARVGPGSLHDLQRSRHVARPSARQLRDIERTLSFRRCGNRAALCGHRAAARLESNGRRYSP